MSKSDDIKYSSSFVIDSYLRNNYGKESSNESVRIFEEESLRSVVTFQVNEHLSIYLTFIHYRNNFCKNSLTHGLDFY